MKESVLQCNLEQEKWRKRTRRNFKKRALVGACAVVTAFSVTAGGSSNGTTQEATTVDSQAEQDSKRAAYREEQSRLAESKAAAAAEAEGTATEAAK